MSNKFLKGALIFTLGVLIAEEVSYRKLYKTSMKILEDHEKFVEGLTNELNKVYSDMNNINKELDDIMSDNEQA